MKRFLFLLVMTALILASPLFGQNFVYDSLGSDLSDTLFPSPLDQALTVQDAGYGPGFLDLEHSYLFGGIANLGGHIAGNTGGPAFTSSIDPVIFGLYRAGEKPWSFVKGLDFTTITGEIGDDVAETFGAPTTVTSGTTDTDYPLLATRTETERSPRLFSDMDVQAQFLSVFGGITMGLYINLIMENQTAAGAGVYSGVNYSETATTYYDAAAVPGTDIPDPAADYSVITTETDMDASGSSPKALDLTLAMPFALPPNGMTQSGNLWFNMRSEDSSTSLKTELSIPSTNTTDVGVAAYDDNETIEKKKVNTIGLNYQMQKDSFLSSHPESRFTLAADAVVTLTGGEFKDTVITQDYSSVAGSLVTGSRNEDVTTATIKSTFGFDFGVTASETVYHEFGPMILFGMMPTANIGFQRSYTTGSVTETVQVVKTDGNGDNTFNNVADTINTITTEYTNTDTAGGGLTHTDTLEIGFSLPTSLKFMPEGWICGFVISNTPSFTFSRDKNVTMSSVSKVTDHTIQGDGSGETTTVTLAENSVESATVDGNWTMQNRTSLGAEFYLPNDILLVVDINGDLWQPEGFTIQAVVPADFLFDK